MPEPHRFDRYELRPAERVLLVDGQPATLGARAFDLLLALIERRQGVVSKVELIKQVWGGAEVAESNLHMQISALRVVLGAQAIATVPGRGYQFTLRLEGAEAQVSGPALNGTDLSGSSLVANPLATTPASPVAPAPSLAQPALPALAPEPEPSPTLPSTRKLAGILSADVVGYSRLMSQDDQGTLQAMVATRGVMATHITRHGGRVVDATGDALLAEFPSAVESVRCAVAIQAELGARNAPLPEARRMVLRIGLNVGDVIEQDAALYGDGVNVAARLQALGEPGGVCISGSIFDQVEGKLPIALRFAGDQVVKNIAKPVRAYHVGAQGPAGATPTRAMDAPAPRPAGKPPPPEYRFSGIAQFELRPDQRLLLADSQPAKLGARAFDVLLALIEHRQRVLTKNELLELVWPGVVVEEGNLQTQVSNLRKLLGPEVIETIPGRGYRFMAALQDAQPSAQAPAVSAGAAAVAPTAPAAGVASATASAAASATASAVAAPAKPEFKTNLPETLPVLFGREDDVAALGALIAQHRLISIIAAGGTGKTRLALQLLHERRSAYEHGVCWVDLSALSDPQLVVSTIAGALGIQTGSGAALQGLLASLKGLTVLVALDNAEHLVDEVARVVQVLIGGAPNLHLLVTSQVPLKCAKERVYRLGPLGVPDTPVPVEEAMSFGAVALFVDCAQAAERHFELTEHNVGTVIDVCHHLDGLALAIELAAARVPLLGLPKLAASLSERLRVLTGGTRTAPQRQKTLRAALEWSHALLSSTEQTVFRRLGVFAGGFTLEMAQQVVADKQGEPALDEWVVLDTLGALVDRSLVMAEAGERPRYRLLESPRAFALERLTAAKEEGEWKRRHAQAVLAHFLAVEADCWGGRMGVDASIAVLEPDLDNGREAMAWAIKHDAHTAVALASPLNFGMTYNRREELVGMWETTEKLLAEDMPETIRAAWALACSRFWPDYKPKLTAQWAEVAIDLHLRTGEPRGRYLALEVLVTSHSNWAGEVLKTRLCELEEIEDPKWPPWILYFGYRARFMISVAKEEWESARIAVDRMRELAEHAGNTDEEFTTRHYLGYLALATNRNDEALRSYLPAGKMIAPTRPSATQAFAGETLAYAYLANGDSANARVTAMVTWPLMRQFLRPETWADLWALLAVSEGRPRAAARLLGFSDMGAATKTHRRQIVEARAAMRSEELAREQLGDAEFERLKGEGSTLRPEALFAIGLGQVDA